MKRYITILALLALPALSGCLAVLDGKIDNRIACTVAGDSLFVISEWGPVGISSKISDKDRAVVCRPPVAMVPAAPASAASGAK